jgi:uncharacterized protein (DUF952 family)
MGSGGVMAPVIYKICKASEWAAALALGEYRGSEHDRRDGFIHFSTAAQVRQTAAKHLAGQPGLVLIAADAAALGPQLKWEPARGGDLFPHLYGTLPAAAAQSVTPLPAGPDGTHQFPELG